MALRLFLVLATVFTLAGVALFFFHAFSYVLALALGGVFALAAVAASALRDTPA